MKNFFFTIDVEIDKSADWSISKNATFNSIIYGLDEILIPLLKKYNIKSTFFISPEVLDDINCQNILLKNQSENIEFATHLHAEFINPERLLFLDNMSKKYADKFQTEYPPEIEYLKLQNLTDKFYNIFKYYPLSFRAGRYAIREKTLEYLSDLKYKIDCSKTPGLKWKNNNHIINYSNIDNKIQFYKFKNKDLISMPISIQKKFKNFNYFYKIYEKNFFKNTLYNKFFLKFLGYEWLRPAYNKNYNLVRYLEKINQENYVMTMHSNEITINTSPYTKTKEDQIKLIKCLEDLFIYINKKNINSLMLKDIIKIYNIL